MRAANTASSIFFTFHNYSTGLLSMRERWQEMTPEQRQKMRDRAQRRGG